MESGAHRIELQIQSALEAVARLNKEHPLGDDPAWTKAVKEELASVGRQLGWCIAASAPDSNHRSEWLYDMVWYQLDGSGHMTDILLVAECEWNIKEAEIKYDFDKLLLARSTYRLMIFQSGSEAKVVDLLRKMRLWVLKYHRTNPGDRYLFAGWAADHWIFDLYVA